MHFQKDTLYGTALHESECRSALVLIGGPKLGKFLAHVSAFDSKRELCDAR